MEENRNAGNEMIWGYLVHLSYNMWADRDAPEWGLEYVSARPYLRFDDSLWNDLLERMVEVGVNMVVIDLGDGVRYENHPEITVRGAWTVDWLKGELTRLREMGLEPIPKLNFSTAHDAWLGPYSRCVSTPTYYEVCQDLIAEVIEIFSRPGFFHLGMDEEKARHQRHYDYVVIRQHDLWWHDLYFLFEEVEKGGVRPWIWSDYLWRHPEAFLEKMPKSVLQSNWYYGAEFEEFTEERYRVRVQAYRDLEVYGYDQIPTGSNVVIPENLPRTVGYWGQHIVPKRLLGFFQTVWRPTLEACRERHLEAVEAVGRAVTQWNSLQ